MKHENKHEGHWEWVLDFVLEVEWISSAEGSFGDSEWRSNQEEKIYLQWRGEPIPSILAGFRTQGQCKRDGQRVSLQLDVERTEL